jgi:Lrp/AsnC family transcriptional regulator for asnA, asnC and gidA
MANQELDRLDDLDFKILAKLVENGQMPYTDVAKQLFVSSGTIHVRMKKMEEMGIVKGARLMLDYRKLGMGLTAFLGVLLERNEAYDEAVKHLSGILEVVEVHFTTGPYSIFCQIACKDTDHMRQVLQDKIHKIPGIVRAEVFVSLDEPVKRPPALEVLTKN